MRTLLALALLVWSGCANRVASFDAEYVGIRGLLQSEQYGSAISRIDSALRRAQRSSDARNLWRFRLLKAEALLDERRLPEVSALLSVDPPNGRAWAEYRARTLFLRGTTAYFLAHYPEADDDLTRAAQLAAQSGPASLSAEVQLRQAYLTMAQGHSDAAETLVRQVIASASVLHDMYLEGVGTGSLGYMLLTASRYDEALVWLERARKLHTQLGANRSMARDAVNLAYCYHRLGDYERARTYYEEARSGFAKTGDQYDEQVLTGDMGLLLEDTGNLPDAAAAYQKAYDIARQLKNDAWASRWASDLAAVTAEVGDWDVAERYNKEAATLQRHLDATQFEALQLNTAGKIAAGRGQVSQAEHLFREAIDRRSTDPRVQLAAQTDLARLYSKTQPRRAEAEFQATIKSIDRLDSRLIRDDYKFGYLASLLEFYRMYVDFLMANHQPERALAIAESSRSHVLAERSGASQRLGSHTAESYRELARRTHAIVLEYWLGEDQSYLWVITPERIRDYRLPEAKTIRRLVAAYQGVILGQRNPLESAAQTGRKLYDMLLAPGAASFGPDCRVILVPDQDLYSLSFESLPAGNDGRHFWIENANVEIAPSLDYLADAIGRRNLREGSGVLVMGDPASALEEFPKLQYAASEINNIRSTMGSSDCTVLEGPKARPEAYAGLHPSDFKFIHFSAHAAANPESPLDSAVILSGPPDRCKLFARDVMSVPLSAELVTISACRSAGAKTYAGEGPVGLAWAFLRAGAQNVIAGLWDVDDRSTAQLMSRLYAEISRGSPPSDALHAAKLGLIQAGGAYAKPFYWAPFQLYAGAP